MMLLSLAADLVVVLHLAYVGFVLFGAILLLRWRWLPLLHLPAVLWGVWVELTGHVCPLTPLEQSLRRAAGEAGYRGGFVEHYLLPILYPDSLTRNTQLSLAGLVLMVNVGLYLVLVRKRWRRNG